ncbi:MAG: septum formation protein Maf [Clostridiales bacterium]|nr:septum formation protein Maf [Clostridiales bacterium]
MSRIILASKSPRRFDLMSLTGLDFEVIVADIDEDQVMAEVINKYHARGIRADMYQIAQEVACAQASAKASAVLQTVEGDDVIVIGSDTVVVTADNILGKPRDEEDARHMLTLLSGMTHRVYTGVSIQGRNKKCTFSSFADVKFHQFDDMQEKMIESYIATGSPMDKAGAYGIQDQGALLIDSISGDYYAVVGLPVARVNRELLTFFAK